MHKILIAVMATLALAGCTARDQQILAAGTVGAVAGAVIANEVNQPRPVYVEERRPVYVVPPRRPHCYSTWENTHRGMVERRICR
jgi:hypothetical protein